MSKMKLSILMLLLIASMTSSQQQTEEEFEQELKDLAIENELDATSSYRCGVFFAGKPNRKPRKEIFIIPKRFLAKCSNPDPEEYKRRCSDLFNKFKGRITWETKSRQRKEGNFTVGDDICELFKKSSNMTAVPNEKIKRGLKIGFYYNYCGNKEWLDTVLRVPERVCCDEKSLYKKCVIENREKSRF